MPVGFKAMGLLALLPFLGIDINIDPISGLPSVLGSIQKPRVISEFTDLDGNALSYLIRIDGVVRLPELICDGMLPPRVSHSWSVVSPSTAISQYNSSRSSTSGGRSSGRAASSISSTAASSVLPMRFLSPRQPRTSRCPFGSPKLAALTSSDSTRDPGT